jgi:hypothetical protein
MYTDAFAFKQHDRIHPGAGKELVDDAGGKKINVARPWHCGFRLFHLVSVVNYLTVKW